MFMMTTVLERLHTTKCSGFLGSRRMLLTVMSVPADVPRGLKVLVHSVVFMFQTWDRNTHARQARHTHARARALGLSGKRGEKRKRRSPTPHLDGPVRRSADDVVPVGGEGGLVHKRRVAAELLQSLARLQPVNSASEQFEQHASKQE